jgi:replicative DNA helicase
VAADINLLSIFLKSRDAFERFSSSVPEHLMENETRTLIADLDLWYKDHQDANGVNNDQIGTFWEWLKLSRHTAMEPDKLLLMKSMLGRAMQAKDTGKAADILKSLTLRDHAGRIAEKADKYSAGDTGIDLYEELLNDVEVAKLDAGIHDGHDHEVTTSFDSIIREVTDLSLGLQWRSPEMNASLGPLRKGNFITVAAFVDTGKSTFLASEASYMASQLEDDEKVILFNNEEEGKVVKLRLLMATTGLTLDQIKVDVPSAVKLYTEYMSGDKDRIIVVDSARISTGMIRRKLRQYNTKLIAIDQLYKVKGFKMNGDDKLGRLQDTFEFGRELAKTYCPVIAIHQARGDANNERYIEMHQLAGSQQAIQGEADAIIMLGRDQETPNARYIYTPKNKLPTPGDQTQRNGKWEVFPNFAAGRFAE